MRLTHTLLILAIGSILPISCTIGSGNLDGDDDVDFGGYEDGSVADGSTSAGTGGKKAGGGGKTAGGGSGGKTTIDGGKAGAAGSAGAAGTAGTAGASDGAVADGATGYNGVYSAVEDVPSGLAVAICDALTDCEGAEYLAYSLNGENCSERKGGVLANRDLVYLQDSIDANRIVYTPDKFDQCLAEIRAQRCNVQNSRRPASCKQAIEGQVALGSRCNIDEECSGKAYCDKGADGMVCPGTCTALIGEDISGCRVSNQCEDGLVCSSLGRCIKLLPINADCMDAPTLCQPGLECHEAVCSPLAEIWSFAEGAACNPANGEMCKIDGAEPLSCVQQASGSPICQKRVEAGGICRGAQPSQCPSGQYCDAATGQEGSCKNLPSENDVCRASNKTPRCAAGLVCEQGATEDRCYAINPITYSCSSAAGCFSGICESGKCVAPLACTL